MVRVGLKSILVCFSCLVLFLCIAQYRTVKQTLIISTYNRFEAAHSHNNGHLDTENSLLLATRNILASKDNNTEDRVISVEQVIWSEGPPEVMAEKKRKKRIFISLGLYNHRKEVLRSIPYDYNFTDTDGTACPVNRCEATYDRSLVKTSDAIYFDARIIHELDVGMLERLRSNSLSQIWIWLMHENPIFTYYNVSKYNQFFNWSATYRPSSDIYIPYFGITKLAEHESRLVVATNFADGKDRKVLVVISHCDDYRMDMIRSLKRYIPVDLYGACKDKINPELQPCHRDTPECDRLMQRYKFYLAIENFYCKDYVTEKYYLNGLIRRIVPVTLNWGDNTNTKDVFLPGSYINIEDFSDMKSLGEHLNYLDKNDTAYNELFKWTSSFNVGLKHGMCKVCQALWENDAKSTTVKLLNLTEFWGKNSSCRSYNEQKFQNYLL